MAGIGNKMASVTITLNGTQEVINGLDNMKARAKELSAEMKAVKEAMAVSASAGNGQLYSQQSAKLTELQGEHKKVTAAIREENKAIKDMNELMQNLDKKTLKQLEQDLKTAKQKFRLIDPSDLANLSKGKDVISSLEMAINKRRSGAGLSSTMKELQGVLANLKTAPLDRLRDAQKRLTDAISTSTRGTKEYKQATEQLKMVNKQIDSVTNSFKGQENAIMKVAKRLASYVAVYMGFNQVISKMRTVISGSLELSDAMADIQKVTKMTEGQVNSLAKAIDSIDTRSSQEQLYKLGYQAGMLGLHTQKDILGFVKAADQMNWALKELGEDGAVQLMKVAQITGDLRNNKNNVELTLLKVGSAINELTANSAASAGPIVDFVSRMGSVGSVCKYSSAELVGIASTLDSLNVHAEMGGTAMNKFMSSLAKSDNLLAISDKLGIAKEELDAYDNSMERMIFVLQKLQQQGDGGMEALSPFFKDLGSDGERLKTVIATLVNNVDTLSEHVQMARDAYDEGKSATNEFLIKNETAAATFQRLGNTIREEFVNSGMVRWLQDVGRYLIDVLKHGERHKALLSTLKIALIAVSTYLTYIVGKKIIAGYKSLVDTCKSLYQTWRTTAIALSTNTAAQQANTAATVTTTTATVAQTGANVAYAGTTTAATTATISFTAALKAMRAVMASNPFGAILVVIGILVSALVTLMDKMHEVTVEQKMLNDATEKASETIAEESAAYNSNYEQLKEVIKQEEEYKNKLNDGNLTLKEKNETQYSLNETEKEHKKLLIAINSKTKEYIGWSLQMSDGIDTVTRSQLQLNSALREQQALMVKTAMLESATEGLKDAWKENAKDMSDSLKELAEGSGIADDKIASFVASATTKIMALVQTGKSVGEINNHILRMVEGKDWEGKLYAGAWMTIKDVVTKAHDAMADFNAISKSASDSYDKTMNDIARNNDSLKGQMSDLYRVMRESYSRFRNATTDAARKAAADEYKLAYDTLNNIGNKMGGEQIYSDFTNYYDEMNNFSRKTVNVITRDAATIRQQMADATLSVADSVAELKKVNKLINLKEDGQNFLNRANELLGTTYTNAAQARTELRKLGQDIIDYQKSQGVTQEGKVSPRTNRKDRNTEERELKADIDAWKNYLKEYYNLRIIEEQKAFDEYQKSGADEKQIAARRKQMDENIKKLQVDQAKQTSEMLNAMLGADNSFQAGNEQMQKFFSALIGDGSLKALSDVAARVRIHGKKIIDNLTKDMSEEEKKHLDKLIKHYDELYKVMVKYDYVQQAEDNFQKSLSTLDLYNDTTYAKMKEMALSGQKLTAETLAEEFEINEEHAEALLVLMSDYHNADIEARKKQKQRRKKIFDEEYEDSLQAIKRQNEMLDENTNIMKEFQSMGLANTQDVNRMEILAVQAKVAAQYEYVEALKASGADAVDAETKLFEIQKSLADKQAELQKNKLAIMGEYCDAVVEFSDAMGNAAFGEVEDRKAAAKELLKTVMKNTSDLIKQQVLHLVQKKLLKKQEQIVDQISAGTEVQIEQAKNQQLNALAAAQAFTDIGREQAKLPGEIADASAKGGAKTVAELGWWGIPLMAVISAALAGLSGLAMSALNKSEADVEAETGVSKSTASNFSKRKVAAGMLTYAVGNYPVLGDDGNTYNARRVNRWNTQVYSGAHYGIIGEKQPELIVDGQTTNKMLTLRPDLYQQILDLRDGIMQRDVRAYAGGNYITTAPATVSASSHADNNLLDAINAMIACNTQLRQTLEGGIAANMVEDFSRDGIINTMEQNRKWMRDHGLLR